MLVVEDDQEFLSALIKVLRPYYVVDTALNGADGFAASQAEDYDAIMLDLGLPDMSGLNVCENIRRDGNATPILVLTGNMEQVDRVTLLNAGADDYVTKPFHAAELLARLRVLIRRTTGYNSARMEVGPLVLDTARRMVVRSGQLISLRKKEFDLLEYLMHSRDRAVTRSMIADHVWETGETPWTNAIDVHIKHLRDKIDRPFPESLIKTVHGVGYKLEAPKWSGMAKEGAHQGVAHIQREEVSPNE